MKRIHVLFVAAIALVLGGVLRDAPVPHVEDAHCAMQAAHLLGCDDIGRDLLQLLWRGTALSMWCAVGAAFISMALGVGGGVLAGHSAQRRRWVDAVCMRAADAASVVPVLPLFLLAAAFVLRGANTTTRMLFVTIGLGVLGWPSILRLVRGLTLELTAAPPVLAARGFGANTTHILRVHVWPVAMPMLLAHLCADVVSNVAAESALSFLGVGFAAQDASLGRLLSSSMSSIHDHPWQFMAPALMLVVCALGVQRVGMMFDAGT
jgi:peptide/nickel transport system permease protein